jgi:hypothetical protein
MVKILCIFFSWYLIINILALIRTNVYRKEKRVLKNTLSNLQDKTNININRVKFIRRSAFGTRKFLNYFIFIEYDKRINEYKDFELMRSLGHEIAHHEFQTIGYFQNDLLNCKGKRVKKIINELFCDLRGRQIGGLTSNETEEYFSNNDVRNPSASNERLSWRYGYFTSSLRAYFVNKYYEDYNNDMFDVELFGNEVIEKYNKLCTQLCREDQSIKDVENIINWIKKKYG